MKTVSAVSGLGRGNQREPDPSLSAQAFQVFSIGSFLDLVHNIRLPASKHFLTRFAPTIGPNPSKVMGAFPATCQSNLPKQSILPSVNSPSTFNWAHRPYETEAIGPYAKLIYLARNALRCLATCLSNYSATMLSAVKFMQTYVSKNDESCQ